MSARSINLTPALYQYILDHSEREHRVLRELREATQKMPRAGMQISPEQGQFMQMLVKLTGAKRCLEVGVFTGYSSLAVALALPREGRIVACDVSEEWTRIAREYWDKADVAWKIELRLAPANQTLDALLAAGEAGKFDFAFIDADKESYQGYYERILKLLRTGGLVALDNTLWSGRVADSTEQDADTVALRKLNDFIHRDERVDVSLLPVGDGLTLVRKK
jgi:caffeoyl-CoA O-methyltransferase